MLILAESAAWCLLVFFTSAGYFREGQRNETEHQLTKCFPRVVTKRLTIQVQETNWMRIVIKKIENHFITEAISFFKQFSYVPYHSVCFVLMLYTSFKRTLWNFCKAYYLLNCLEISSRLDTSIFGRNWNFLETIVEKLLTSVLWRPSQESVNW